MIFAISIFFCVYQKKLFYTKKFIDEPRTENFASMNRRSPLPAATGPQRGRNDHARQPVCRFAGRLRREAPARGIAGPPFLA
jgi:hypothetical protein